MSMYRVDKVKISKKKKTFLESNQNGISISNCIAEVSNKKRKKKPFFLNSLRYAFSAYMVNEGEEDGKDDRNNS